MYINKSKISLTEKNGFKGKFSLAVSAKQQLLLIRFKMFKERNIKDIDLVLFKSYFPYYFSPKGKNTLDSFINMHKIQ